MANSTQVVGYDDIPGVETPGFDPLPFPSTGIPWCLLRGDLASAVAVS